MRRFVPPRDLAPGRFSSADLVRLAASLVLAILLWGWVTTSQDPIETEVFAGLAVQAPQLPNALLVVGELPDVTVTLEGPRSVLEDVTAADLEPRLDLDQIDEPGSYTVEVEVSEPDGARSTRIEPAQVPIVVEETVTKVFPLQVVRQQPEDGTRTIGRVEPEVSEVNVSGPSSLVARVNRVILPISIGERTADYVDEFSPVAQDASGSRMPEVTIAPDRVRASVQVATEGKSVAVIPQVTGAPAEGYQVTGRTAEPQTVLVDGPDDVLANLISVSTDPVDIEGATDTVTRRVGLQPPEGVRVFEPSDGVVTVEVQIGQVGVTQTLPVPTVSVVGLGEGLVASVEPSGLNVAVEAAESILTGLTAEDITVQVNVEGLGPGTYRRQPSVAVPANVEWVRIEPESVTVTISRGPAGTPLPGVGGLGAAATSRPSPTVAVPPPPP